MRKSSQVSFSVMRNRLCLKNLPKYSDHLKLDKDLLVLQRAYYKMIKVLKWDPEEGNWQPLIIIEQFQHAKVDPLFDSEKIL